VIWLTWRQFRTQAIVASGALTAFAVALAVTGPQLAGLYTAGLGACADHGNCAAAAASYLAQLRGTDDEFLFYAGIAVTYLAPALIGIFWGAPLITREFETGTFRLAWSQSVTRARWLAVKLGLIVLAAMTVAGLLSLMTGWWASPLYRAAGQASSSALSINRFEPALFGATGIVPIGYAAFGFAFGVTAGVLIRRTVPAMVATLAGFAIVQVAWLTWIRPHLISPLHATSALRTVSFNGVGDFDNGTLLLQVGSVRGRANAWITGTQPVSAAGQAISRAPHACMSISAHFLSCLSSHGVQMAVTYQPASRYWAFQWYESAIYVALAVALAGVCAWRIRRRRS
jgi:hypothetical protein